MRSRTGKDSCSGDSGDVIFVIGVLETVGSSMPLWGPLFGYIGLHSRSSWAKRRCFTLSADVGYSLGRYGPFRMRLHRVTYRDPLAACK